MKSQTEKAAINKKRTDASSRTKAAQLAQKQEDFLRVYEEKLTISRACRATGVGRRTVYHWLENDDFKKRIEEAKDGTVDWVEGKLFERIQGVRVLGEDGSKENQPVIYSLPPDVSAIKFFLSCKARERGYGNKQEVTINTSKVKEMTDDELKASIATLRKENEE